ncbi:MAG: SAF domain-containing protein [Dermatophilaceae bacterium]
MRARSAGLLARQPRVRSRRTAYRIALARKLTAAALAGTAVFAAVRVLAPPSPAGRVDAVVTTRDVPAGTVLSGADLAVVTRDPSDLPTQVVADPSLAVGQAVAGPVAAGELLTTVRLGGRSLLSGQPAGVVAVGVPVADASLIDSVHPGDEVTVHSLGSGTQVAHGTVLSVRSSEPSTGLGQSGSASVVLAVPDSDAAAIAAGLNGPGNGFMLALHSGPG